MSDHLIRSGLAISLLAVTALGAAPLRAKDAVIAYEPVMETGHARAVPSPALEYADLSQNAFDAAPTAGPSTARNDSTFVAQVFHRASRPASRSASAFSIGRNIEAFEGGKLLLTNGISNLEGASGGGIAKWATIAGLEMDRGLGASAHFSAVELPDFGYRSGGAAVGVFDRVELSYAHQNFDTRDVGAALGLGQGYDFTRDVFGAKLRLAGDAVYGAPFLPQISAGIEYKRNGNAPVVALLGAQDDEGVDYTLSATKLLLSHSVLVNATARYTKANQLGLLGFGGPDAGYAMQFEGSLGYQLSRRAVIGAEYRTKPDNLGLGEDDWLDLFAAYAVTDNLTLSAAYVDLGSIATFEDQRGAFVQAQVAF